MSAEHNQSSIEAQQELQNIRNGKCTKLVLSTGRTIKIGYLYSDAQDKIDDIIVEHDAIAKQIKEGTLPEHIGNRYTRQLHAKFTAAVLLNSPIRITLFWWLKWRIIHRFWRLNGDDYLAIITEAKKKVMGQSLYLGMALVMTMSDTVRMMTTKEAEAFRRELNLAREQPQ